MRSGARPSVVALVVALVVMAALSIAACSTGNSGGSGSSGGGVEIDDWDGANWMRDLAPLIGDRPLSRIVIPGTHDAGTFSFPPSGASIAVAQGDTGTAQFEGLPPEFVLDAQVTQTMDWAEQLDAGIRYFDFRVVCDPDGMFIVHTFKGQSIGRALGEIAEWMRAHPREVLLLDVQKNYGCATQTYDISGSKVLGNDALTDLVRVAFGNALAPRPASADAPTTLNSLVAAGTNVVPFLIDTDHASRSGLWWLRASNALPPGAGMTNVWDPIITMPEMYDHLVAAAPAFDGRGASQLLLGSLTTSPMFPKETGIANWYRDWRAGRQVGSLREFVTTAVLPDMPRMIEGAAGAGYSVLSTDFPELGRWPGGRSFARLVAGQNLVPGR